MPWKYNPFTDALDQTGSGGASYINGVVADPTALPVTLGTPALDSVFLAKAGSGVWLINRRPAGLYCRTANNGVAADWTYLGAFPEVNADGNWELYNSTDPTKELKFDLSGLPTATTRIVNAPDGNGKMLVEGQSIGATTRNTGAFTTLSANNGTITASAPVLDLSQTWNNAAVTFTGLRFNVTNTASAAASLLADFQVGGTTQFAIRRNGSINVPSQISLTLAGQATPIEFDGSGTPAPSVIANQFIANGDVMLTGGRFGTGNVIIRTAGASSAVDVRGTTLTTPQAFRIYNTTDAGLTNFERGFMRWSSNVLQIGTEKAGTGSARALELQSDGVTRLTVQTGGTVALSSHLTAENGFIRIASAQAFQWLNRSKVYSLADGNIGLYNAGENGFNLLQFGGTTSSFPALKRSSTTLQVRLADDSAFAPLIASQIGIGVASPERPLHIQATDALGRIDRVGTAGPAFLMVRMATLGTPTSSWIFGPATGFASVANDDFAIIDYGTSVTGTSGTQRLTIAKSDGQLTVNGNLNLSTKNLVTDTTTGTKIGTATTQKLGFFNATPVDQPNTVADPTGGGTIDAEARTAINDIIDRLQELGLIA